MAGELTIDTIEIVSQNEYGEAIAVLPSVNQYYMGDIDGDIFVNAFNVKLKGHVRDDECAIAYFSEKYGYEA